MTCQHCVDSQGFFDRRTARRDLKRYRRRGPRASSRLLIDRLRPHATGATLLDIGGGVGLIQHELFDSGLDTAVQVDASAAYLEASREEATRRGHLGRERYVHGDFVDVQAEVGGSDLVTLDRVVCCYPEIDALLSAAGDHTRLRLGLVFPRSRLPTRLLLAAGNLVLRIRGSSFQVYLHSVPRMDAILRDHGLILDSSDHTFAWTVRVYRRADGTAIASENSAPA